MVKNTQNTTPEIKTQIWNLWVQTKDAFLATGKESVQTKSRIYDQAHIHLNVLIEQEKNNFGTTTHAAPIVLSNDAQRTHHMDGLIGNLSQMGIQSSLMFQWLIAAEKYDGISANTRAEKFGLHNDQLIAGYLKDPEAALRCQLIMKQAKEVYNLSTLTLLQPLPTLYADSNSLDAIGIWAGLNVPKSGYVSGCLPKGSRAKN